MTDIKLSRVEGGLDCELDLATGRRALVSGRDAVVQGLERRFDTPINCWIGGPHLGSRLHEARNGPRAEADQFARGEIMRILNAEPFLLRHSGRVYPTESGARAYAQLLDGSPVHFEFTLNKDA